MPLAMIVFASMALTHGPARGAETKTAGLRPNVIIILADDMGYGDPRCFNPESKIETPHVDRLAKQGIRFTNAHSPSSLCVPTRYGLLTGRYPVRTWTEKGAAEKRR
jgi:arylsulfatase A-like enzyme